MNESWDNACVQINFVLIVMPCFKIGSFCAIILSVITDNFFGSLKFFDLLKTYISVLDFNLVTTFYIRKIKDENNV